MDVNCYRISVEKDAQTALTRTYDWDIYKVVTPTFASLYEDESTTLKYTVGVTKTGEYTDSNWLTTGVITVTNPAPKEAVLSSVQDTLSDGTPVTVNCASDLTVEANDTLTCTYSANPQSGAPRLNTAKAILAGKTYTGTADVDFTTASITEVYTQVNVTDANVNGITNTVINSAFGPWDATTKGTYEVPVACADYSSQYDDSIQIPFNNTATITENGKKDTARADVQCIKYGKISLTKSTVGAATWSFGFTLNSVTKNVTNGEPTVTWDGLIPSAIYTMTEVSPGADWIVDPIACKVDGQTIADANPDGDGFQIDLGPGQNVICEATNTKKAVITVEKVTVPSNSTETFAFVGDLPGSIGNGEQISATVAPGSYAVTEMVPAGWVLTSAECTEGGTVNGATSTFDATPGSDITCTYTNTKGLAQIFFETPTATNAVNTTHDFTVTVQTSEDNGATWQPVSGQIVTGTLAAPLFGTLNTPTCTTNEVGQCALQVTADGAGVTNLNATADVDVLGLITTVTTSGSTGEFRNAEKIWADLRIKIGDTATNPLNEPHTFTVKVEKKVGSADWEPVVGVSPSVAYSPVPATPGSSPVVCGPTDADGECTVTINSPVAGVFTAQAGVTVNMAPTGQPVQNLTRTTGTPVNVDLGGSGNAVKTYKEGALLITKSVTPTFNRTFDWTIQKDVNPATLELFDGQSQSVDYTVKVTKSDPIDSAHAIAGNVTIKNTDATNPVIVNEPVDKLANGNTITLNCGVGTWPRTIPAGGQIDCTYGPTTVAPVASTNYVTVTTTSSSVFTTTKGYAFTTPTVTTKNEITVTDSKHDNGLRPLHGHGHQGVQPGALLHHADDDRLRRQQGDGQQEQHRHNQVRHRQWKFGRCQGRRLLLSSRREQDRRAHADTHVELAHREGCQHQHRQPL